MVERNHGCGGWTLTSLQQRVVKTGGRLVKHARYYWLLLAESHLTRRLFASMVRRTELLPLPGGWNDRRGKGISDEMVGGGKVSATSVNRGLVPTRSGLRRAKTGPVCGQWRDRAALTRIAVALGAGQMYAAGRR